MLDNQQMNEFRDLIAFQTVADLEAEDWGVSSSLSSSSSFPFSSSSFLPPPFQLWLEIVGGLGGAPMDFMELGGAGSPSAPPWIRHCSQTHSPRNHDYSIAVVCGTWYNFSGTRARQPIRHTRLEQYLFLCHDPRNCNLAFYFRKFQFILYLHIYIKFGKK